MTAQTLRRRTAARLSALACVVVVALSVAPASAAADEAPTREQVQAAMESEVVEFINRERVDAGLHPLEVWPDNSLAVESNEDHAASGEAHRLADHFRTAYAAQGASWSSEVQNFNAVSAGTGVVRWRESPGHNAIMLDERATHVAVAVRCETPRHMTAQFVAAEPDGGQTPTADEAATRGAGDWSCSGPRGETSRGQSSDEAVAEIREALSAFVVDNQQYLPHAAGGLAALLLLAGLARRSASRAEARQNEARTDADRELA
jgi:uncharacterized protein YkwD